MFELSGANRALDDAKPEIGHGGGYDIGGVQVGGGGAVRRGLPLAGLKGEEKEAAGCDDAPELGGDRRESVRRGVDDRVPAHDAIQRRRTNR